MIPIRILLKCIIAAGTDAIVAVGTTGESPTVDFDEHNELIRVAVEAAAGRIPVIAEPVPTQQEKPLFLPSMRARSVPWPVSRSLLITISRLRKDSISILRKLPKPLTSR